MLRHNMPAHTFILEKTGGRRPPATKKKQRSLTTTGGQNLHIAKKFLLAIRRWSVADRVPTGLPNAEMKVFLSVTIYENWWATVRSCSNFGVWSTTARQSIGDRWQPVAYCLPMFVRRSATIKPVKSNCRTDVLRGYRMSVTGLRLCVTRAILIVLMIMHEILIRHLLLFIFQGGWKIAYQSCVCVCVCVVVQMQLYI